MTLDDILSQHFGSSPHTVGSILKSIHAKDDSHNDILERVSRIDVEELQGAGFLSFVYRIRLEMKDGKEKKLIVKVSPICSLVDEIIGLISFRRH